MGVREVFDRSAREYDRTRRQLVPCFDEFYGAALDALPGAEAQSPSILDLGSGTGLLSLFAAAKCPRARLTLVDVAPAMLDVARERFTGQAERFEFRVCDYAQVPLGGPYDCIVSALSIHHLEGNAKAALFTRAHDALQPGGVFVNADQVAGATAAEEAGNRAQWLAEVRAHGTREEDLRAALERMREDRPSTVAAQLQWLSAAGFADVGCIWQRGMFAVFTAWKARTK